MLDYASKNGVTSILTERGVVIRLESTGYILSANPTPSRRDAKDLYNATVVMLEDGDLIDTLLDRPNIRN